MNLSLKAEKYFPQVSIFVLLFNYVFRYYYLLNCAMQFAVTAWGLFIIISKYPNQKNFVRNSLFVTGLFFFIYILKGTLTVSWTFFIKVICLFIFIGLLERDKIENYFNTFCEIVLFFSISVIIISFLSMLFIHEGSIIPSILKQVDSNLYECALSQHYSDRYIGFLDNSNKSAMFSSICIFSSIYLILIRSKYSLLSIISLILNLAIVYATKSRGTILTICLFILLLPFIFVLYTFYNYSNKTKKRIIFTLVFLLSLLFLFALICLLSPTLYSFLAYVFRFTIPEDPTIINKLKAIINSLQHGSGRDELLIIDYNLFKQSPIIGVSYPILDNAAPNLVHNGFLFSLFLLGIPLFCITIVIVYIISIRPIIYTFRARKDFTLRELFLISFATTIIICCFFYNCFEILIGPISIDGYTILFLICSGILFNLTRKNSPKRVA